MGVTDAFLRPDRIALVGVSRDPGAITARPAHYLHAWSSDAEVVVVHPNATGTLHGHPTVSRIADAGPGDVALLLVPAGEVPDTVSECAAAGFRSAISIASGFEGEAGRARREQLLEVLTAHPDFRLLGPNCVGPVSPMTRTPLSFSSVLLDERPEDGAVALVTQSGAIGNAVMLALGRRGVGIACWFSTGDELDVGALEVTASLVREPSISAVGLFLEGITDPYQLPDLRAAIQETGCRVVALRSTSSAAARNAAFGHTGRVVGDSEIAAAALVDAGVHLVDSLGELTDVLTVLSCRPAQGAGPAVRVGVVTVSGGMGVLAADAIAAAPGLRLSELAEAAEAVEAVTDLPLTITNPLDVPVLGKPEIFPRVLDAVATHPSSDVVIAIVSSLAHDYDLLASAPYGPGARIVFTHLSPEERFTPQQARELVARGFPAVPSPETAVRGLSIDTGLHEQPDRSGVPAHAAPDRGEDALGFRAAVRALGLEDLAAPTRPVANLEEVRDFARHHDAIVLKANGSRIIHRTDAGALAVDLREDPQVQRAWKRVSRVCREHGDEVVAQAMADPGIEVLVTVTHDPEVGPAAVLRPGGILTELMTGSIILTGDPAHWTVDRLRDGPLGKLLGGWRGNPSADTEALMALARRLHHGVVGGGTVECNPVIVHGPGRGVTVVDVLASVDMAGL